MIKHKISLIALLWSSIVLGQFPAQDMGLRTLGTSISATLRGQEITSANVPSHEHIYMWNLAYAPVSYVLITGGIGFDRFEVDKNKDVEFNGDMGVSPTLGLSLYTPMFLNFLRITCGANLLYMNSEDANDFKYSGVVINSHLGAIFSISSYLDFNTGLKLHQIEGTMYQPGAQRGDLFSNANNYRFYASLMVKSVQEQVFFNIDFDISPEVNTDWSNGPSESTVGLSIGFFFGWKERKKKTASNPLYFEGYKELKEKQKKMTDDFE
jgi:hypothetical protein